MSLQSTAAYVEHSLRPARTAKRFSWWLLLVFVAAFPAVEGLSNSVTPIGTRVAGAVLAGAWVVETIVLGRIRVGKGLLLTGAFFAWSAASLLWSASEASSIERTLALLQVLIFYWIVLDLSEPTEIGMLLLSYVVGVGVLAATAVANIAALAGYNGYSNRFSALGTDPNNFGVMMASAIACSLAFLKSRAWWVRAAVVCYAAAGAILIIATASRGALIALAVVLGGFVLAPTGRAQNRLTKTLIAIVIGAFLLIVVPLAVPQQAIERLGGGFMGDRAGGRFVAWQLAGSIGATHLATGVGAGAFYPLTSGYLSEGMEAHSTFLLAFAELGVPGFLLWLAIWIWHYMALRRPFRGADRATTMAIFLGLSATLVAGLSLNWETRKPLYLFWAIAAAWSRARLTSTSEASGTLEATTP